MLDDFLSHPIGQRIRARMDEQDKRRAAVVVAEQLRKEKMMAVIRAGEPITPEKYEDLTRVTPIEVAQALGDLEALHDAMEVGDTLDMATMEIKDRDGKVKVPGIKKVESEE